MTKIVFLTDIFKENNAFTVNCYNQYWVLKNKVKQIILLSIFKWSKYKTTNLIK